MEAIWSIAALKEYVDKGFAAQHREHDKFEVEVHDSMYKQNEFRGALSDLSLTMFTRREMEAIEDKYDTRLGRTESIQAKIVGALILVSAVLMPGVVIVTYFISH